MDLIRRANLINLSKELLPVEEEKKEFLPRPQLSELGLGLALCIEEDVSIEEKIQSLTRRIEELRVEVSDSRYAHEMKSKELTHAFVECESNKVSIEKLKSELNDFEVEQKSLNVENQSLREEVSKCKQETSRVNYDLSLLQAKYDSLLEKSSKQEEAVSKAQSELAESNKRLAVTMHINSGVSNWLTYQYTFFY